MASALSGDPLSLWEKIDFFAGHIPILGSTLYSLITGPFRGESGPKQYNLHVLHAAVRKMTSRMSLRQLQYRNPSTSQAYEEYMRMKGLQPETVLLEHDAKGHWIGDKDAKMVIVYYHGGGFNLPGLQGHFSFLTQLIEDLNTNNTNQIAIFFLNYTLSPPATYPTQLRQSVQALRYILTQPNRDPSTVLLGGDSAGGNLALAVLLHLTHPHPEIDALDEVVLPAPLAGVFGFAPWVSFALGGDSMRRNKGKDVITVEALRKWREGYLAGGAGDPWSEPGRAPGEWWVGVKAKEVLVLVGTDEILFSAVEEFVDLFKTVVPQTTYIVGRDETHVSPVYSGTGMDGQQARGLRNWLAAQL